MAERPGAVYVNNWSTDQLRLLLDLHFDGVADMVSFYTLPSTVMHHPVHRTLKAAYSFYNVSIKTAWIDLMQDALISAKNVSTKSHSILLTVKCIN